MRESSSLSIPTKRWLLQTNRLKIYLKNKSSGFKPHTTILTWPYGGIGRHTGLRSQSESSSVRVRVSLGLQILKAEVDTSAFFVYICKKKRYMRKTIILLLAIAVIMIAVIFALNNSDNKLKAPNSWFEKTTTEAPNDITPFINKDVSDSAFHFWSWQKFLSLTRSNETKAPFEGLLQVDNYGNKIGSIIELNDSSQAGSDAVLYDKSNRAIYYTIHFNQSMYDFQQKYQPVFAEIINKYKTENNPDIKIQIELHKLGLDTINFPVSTFILKTSWILASSLKSTDGYYVTDGVFPSDSCKTVKIALIGMHIIGRVYNHPEFIWATYEHRGLAPTYAWSHDGYPKLDEIISDKNYVFYNANTNFNNCPMNNQPCSSPQFSSVFNIYPHGTVKSFVSGKYPDKKDMINEIMITSLDKSVKKHLSNETGVWKNYFYKGSTWLTASNSNFGPGNPNIGSLTNPSLNGARAISNITMETFTQLFTTGVYTGGSMNCFGCHNTVDFNNPIINGDSLSYNLCVSHSFRNGVKQRVMNNKK